MRRYGPAMISAMLLAWAALSAPHEGVAAPPARKARIAAPGPAPQAAGRGLAPQSADRGPARAALAASNFDSYVILYEHCDFQGRSLAIDYPLDIDLLSSAQGGTDWNDMVSSIRVHGGARVRLYEHMNWTGDHRTFSDSVSCFSTLQFNDKATSLEWH